MVSAADVRLPAPGDVEAFAAYVAAGGLVDAGDWMPEEYRAEAARIVSFQALAEVVGTLLFAEWLPRVASVHRKRILTAKVQDEVGHGHILMRVAEDLGLPREQVMEEYLAGRRKLLNAFHYGFDTYCELPIGALLQNSAAITQFRSLVKGSYLPYVRALREIMREESFHFYNALDWTHELITAGTPRQKAEVEAGLVKWWPILVAYFGPPDAASVHTQPAMRWRLKVNTNDEVRQAWFTFIVPVLQGLGLTPPDPKLRYDSELGRWEYTEPDWAEVKAVINGGGPRSAYWKELVRKAYERDGWVRHVRAAA